MQVDRWVDSHMHVSRLSPEGDDRGDVFEPLMAMMDGAGAPLEGIFSPDLPDIHRMMEDPNHVLTANRFTFDLAQRAPGRIHGGCMVNPHFLNESIETMEVCFGEWGFVQLGEMLQYIMEYPMDSPEVIELGRRAVEFGVPINVHVSTNTEKGVDHISDLFTFADKVPGLKIVAAHCLGGKMSDYYLDVLAARRGEGRAENLWIEVRDFNNVRVLRRALDEGWEDRLISGTDWTNRVGPPFLPFGVVFGVTTVEENPYPPGVAALVGFLKEAGDSDEQMEKIAWRNADSLFFDKEHNS